MLPIHSKQQRNILSLNNVALHSAKENALPMARKITMAMTGRTRVQSLGADTVLQAAATVLLPWDNRYREGGRGRGDTRQRTQNTPLPLDWLSMKRRRRTSLPRPHLRGGPFCSDRVAAGRHCTNTNLRQQIRRQPIRRRSFFYQNTFLCSNSFRFLFFYVLLCFIRFTARTKMLHSQWKRPIN